MRKGKKIKVLDDKSVFHFSSMLKKYKRESIQRITFITHFFSFSMPFSVE